MMQATIGQSALKPFIKALTCLARYGDDLVVHATPESITLSCTNLAMSAYCSVTYSPHFFTKYIVGDNRPSGATNSWSGSSSEVTNSQGLNCQLLAKSLLSILKHRNHEKGVEKCELSVIEGGGTPDENDEQDNLESRLIVRLHCKHGIVKTHRLLLNEPNNTAPVIAPAPNESCVVVGAQTVKEIVDHFPGMKGSKSDPTLVWTFDATEVNVRSTAGSSDTRGKLELATELTIDAEEFDAYEVFAPPITIGFHLREFNATIAFAESQSYPLTLRFTAPAEPLFITINADEAEMLSIISTVTVRGNDPPPPDRSTPRTGSAGAGVPAARKRPRTEDVGRPSKVVQRSMLPPAPVTANAFSSTPQGSTTACNNASQSQAHAPPQSQAQSQAREPLFLASQMSAVAEEAVRASGLGIEDMDADEFAAMLEGDGDEVMERRRSGSGSGNASASGSGTLTDDSGMDDGGNGGTGDDEGMYVDDVGEDDRQSVDSFALVDNEPSGFGPTQDSRSNSNDRMFKPLFED